MPEGPDGPAGSAPVDPHAVAGYIHGHRPASLTSHGARGVADSARYLVAHLRPDMRILDVGCGPGSITRELAALVPDGEVVGVDPNASLMAQQQALGGPANVTFLAGDVHDLPADLGAFDVVHAHQVLQHLTDPVGALRAMAAACRPGGTVAVRDADYAAFAWAPADPRLDRWLRAYRDAAHAVGCEPDAGRHLLGWAHRAGLPDAVASTSTWCYATPASRARWADLWIDRVTAVQAPLGAALAADGPAVVEGVVDAWRGWAADPAGWFSVLHGELLITV